MVLAATNRVDIIDPAILRAGRFDIILELPIPDRKARFKILKIHTKGKPLAKNINLDELAHETEDWTGADIEAMARRASMEAVRKYIEKNKEKLGLEEIKGFAITKRHFEEAIRLMKKQRNN